MKELQPGTGCGNQRILVLGLLLALSGCATPKRDLGLERLAAEWAQTLPAEREFAALEAAQVDSLLLALRTASNTREREQLAYLVERRITLYQTTVALKKDQARLEVLDDEHREMLLEAARREAERAHLDAEKLRLQRIADEELAERAAQDAEVAETARLEQAQLDELNQLQSDAASALAQARARELELAQREADLRGAEGAPLSQQLAGLKARKTERGMALVMGDVFFASGQGTLKPEARDHLQPVLDFIQRYPNLAVSIEGHSDDRGKQAANLELSQRRADSVRLGLLALGAKAKQLRARGLGEAQPLANNRSVAGRAKNRRVEIIVLGAPN